MAAVDLTDRVALVTGAGKRLGRAIALDLAAAGCRVAVHYRGSAREAAETAAACTASGAPAQVFQADLATDDGPASLIDAVVRDLGRLDLLVCCAAVYRKTPWAHATLDDWRFHLDANLTATYQLCRAATPVMTDGGCIVTFGDWAGERPYVDFLPYCVSKAGVIALTKALAQEVAPRLRVNCVCPGTVLPPENASAETIAGIAAQTPLARIGDPADIVAGVRFLVAGSDYTTGVILNIDGGRLIANGRAY